MKIASSSELRKAFLDYFHDLGHEIVPSSSLVPINDPTLLFVNAGMVQFKEVFLGFDKRSYCRATSSQRCVRAGGKHNDLENVGYTARHHTFFEMLGNFSFGDYFKRDAIAYAWKFLTEVVQLPPERLWVTVYEEDDEAADIWLKEIKVDPSRFGRIGAKDNFWSMGDTGPCGPCTEIFYDHGPEIPGGPPGSADEDGDRYIEIWNLVFMQYDRDSEGNLHPLPAPSVDTGMGLERLAAVLQGVHSNYEIDLFRTLIDAAAKATGCKDSNDNSLKVIADHIRSCAFLIVDGVLPSNEGRGYVLRRIIRRAVRHGYRLGCKEPFFHQLVATLVDEMGDAYPELVASQARTEQVLRVEEQRFAETVEQGMRILEQAIHELKDARIPGDVAFRLYDTYGFPLDLTADIARERNLSVDIQGFEAEMQAQRARARQANQFGVDYSDRLSIEGRTEFTGYTHLQDQATVEVIIRDGETVTALHRGESGALILTQTPFYAESGGQVGDQGTIAGDGWLFQVNDTQKHGANVHAHHGTLLQGTAKTGDPVQAMVNEEARQSTALNHSATHLLHAALRTVLGEHVTQKGSLVQPERLRFDFSHFEVVSEAQLSEIERLVNEQIRLNSAVETQVTDYDTAVANGAMALFGEKYGNSVRVLRIGDFSTELCGGTHVARAGDIGVFKILSETGIAAGVRRIEALTGAQALRYLNENEKQLHQVAQLVKGGRDDVTNKVVQLIDRNKKLEKELQQLKGQLASAAGDDLAQSAVEVSGIQVLAARIEGADVKSLRETVDKLKNKLGSAAVVLASVQDDRVTLIAGVTKDQTSRIKAGELVNAVAMQVGGKGGGRPDMAQAGGNKPAALETALASVAEWVAKKLS